MANIPPKNTLHQKPTGERKTGRSAKDNQNGMRAIDLATLIQTIKDEGVAYRREEQREDRGKAHRERITIGLIFCTFIAVCWQVYEMIHVYGPIHDQAVAAGQQAAASDKAANAAIRAADATTKAADAATKQSENSDRSLAQSQRAWVGPRNAKSERSPELNKELAIMIEYQNSGREPALETIYDSDVFTVANEQDQLQRAAVRINNFVSECKMKWTPSYATVVFPSSGLSSGYELTKTLAAEQIDQEVVDGKKLIFLSGCFVYKTVGSIHRSSFCYFFQNKKTKPSNWNICSVGNDAD